jgi:inner membrane protein
MDSLTHLALGAAVGEAVLGAKIGNRAALWGAIVGTLPDLDVVLAPFQDDIGFLVHHRGLSHSFAAVAAAALLLAAFLARRYRGHPREPGFRHWLGLTAGCLLTHVLLDVCTTYGTPVLLPWSDVRVSLGNLFIVDPLVTLPLLIGVGACLFLRAGGRARRAANALGLGLACLYLALTMVHKAQAHREFSRALALQGIDARRMMTGTTPLNSILWFGLAETDQGYYVGYHSVLAGPGDIRFEYLPRGDRLLEGMEDSYPVDRLRWFSDGYYAVRQGDDGAVVLHVLKFGLLTLDGNVEHAAFSYALQRDAQGGVSVRKLPRPPSLDWRRIAAAFEERLRRE